jgi:hypothetical protein
MSWTVVKDLDWRKPQSVCFCHLRNHESAAFEKLDLTLECETFLFVSHLRGLKEENPPI